MVIVKVAYSQRVFVPRKRMGGRLALAGDYEYTQDISRALRAFSEYYYYECSVFYIAIPIKGFILRPQDHNRRHCSSAHTSSPFHTALIDALCPSPPRVSAVSVVQ